MGGASRIRLVRNTDERLVAGVRRGERSAFRSIYERHAPELLSFCRHMLGSRQDAEDAVQATFACAYRAMLNSREPIALRPWLFTIARNRCLSILRARRPTVELNGEPALTDDPVKRAEVREELAHMIHGIRELPEAQRSALVLAEVHGLRQAEIATVLGVRAEQVKAYIYQARSNLISARGAREASCHEIREELATVHASARLRGGLRRHLRSCDACRLYADDVGHQRRQLTALFPVFPSLAMKYQELEAMLKIGAGDAATYANGASAAAGAAEVAGGGATALLVKLAAGLAAVGASAGVGVSVLNTPARSGSTAAPAARAAGASLVASLGRGAAAHGQASAGERGQAGLSHTSGGRGESANFAREGRGGGARGGFAAGAGRHARGATVAREPVERAGGGQLREGRQEPGERASNAGTHSHKGAEERTEDAAEAQKGREERSLRAAEHRRAREAQRKQAQEESRPREKAKEGKHGGEGGSEREKEKTHKREEGPNQGSGAPGGKAEREKKREERRRENKQHKREREQQQRREQREHRRELKKEHG